MIVVGCGGHWLGAIRPRCGRLGRDRRHARGRRSAGQLRHGRSPGFDQTSQAVERDRRVGCRGIDHASDRFELAGAGPVRMLRVGLFQDRQHHRWPRVDSATGPARQRAVDCILHRVPLLLLRGQMHLRSLLLRHATLPHQVGADVLQDAGLAAAARLPTGAFPKCLREGLRGGHDLALGQQLQGAPRDLRIVQRLYSGLARLHDALPSQIAAPAGNRSPGLARQSHWAPCASRCANLSADTGREKR